eukprot:6203928-Pleurochrysis_carterae.AAC.6
MKGTTTVNGKADVFTMRAQAAGVPITQSSRARHRKGSRARSNAEVHARVTSAAAARTLQLRGVKRRLFTFKTCARDVPARARIRRRAVCVFVCGSGFTGGSARSHGLRGKASGVGPSRKGRVRGDNGRTNVIGSVLLQVVPSRKTPESSVQ